MAAGVEKFAAVAAVAVLAAAAAAAAAADFDSVGDVGFDENVS